MSVSASPPAAMFLDAEERKADAGFITIGLVANGAGVKGRRDVTRTRRKD
jgi:hypothetical protein